MPEEQMQMERIEKEKEPIATALFQRQTKRPVISL